MDKENTQVCVVVWYGTSSSFKFGLQQIILRIHLQPFNIGALAANVKLNHA